MKVAKAKKTEGREREVWTVGVLADSDSHVTREGDPDDRWDRDNTSTSWHVRGLYLVEDDKPSYGYRSYSDSTVVNFNPVKGKLYHLLYAVYSTGDSFGHDDGRCFEVIGVYKSRKVAEENEKRLLEGTPSRKGEYGNNQVLLKLEGTTKQQPYSRPWDGYFESLNYIEVLSLVLN